ncbi:MAG: sensor histidine kinase [Pyrinomonadaceae bacterium]
MPNCPAEPSGRFVAGAKIFSRTAGASAVLVGALVLAGWLFDVHWLKSVYGDITMKANAALLFLLAGASLWAVGAGEERTLARRAWQACAAAAVLVGLMTLSEHLFGWNLGIDQLLLTEPPGASATTSPGRMGPLASACFTLAGIALMLLHARRAVSLAQLLSLAVCLLALLPAVGYAYGTEALYGVARYTGIALHTALTLFVLGLGLLSARAGEGAAAVISSSGSGGTVARRLLLAAVCVPLLLGWASLLAQRAGYFDLGFGTAALVLSIINLFTAIIWRSAAKLNDAERKRLVAEAAARDEAEKASRLKDEFLATVSHELRTPLTAILGWAAMLKKGDIDEATSEHALSVIERNAKTQAQLIEDLLDVSRIVSGKLRLEVEPTDLASVIKAAADSVRPAGDAKGVQMELALDPAAGHVQGDATRLQQVVWNLLSNAIKFAPQGGTVRVGLERADSAARVTVSDTGEGISPEFLPRVFERFQQADGIIKRDLGGLGLGLTIVRHIVEMHGGGVEAFSEGAGSGATFTVTLPLPAARTNATPPTLSTESAQTEETPPDTSAANL